MFPSMAALAPSLKQTSVLEKSSVKELTFKKLPKTSLIGISTLCNNANISNWLWPFGPCSCPHCTMSLDHFFGLASLRQDQGLGMERNVQNLGNGAAIRILEDILCHGILKQKSWFLVYTNDNMGGSTNLCKTDFFFFFFNIFCAVSCAGYQFTAYISLLKFLWIMSLDSGLFSGQEEKYYFILISFSSLNHQIANLYIHQRKFLCLLLSI